MTSLRTLLCQTLCLSLCNSASLLDSWQTGGKEGLTSAENVLDGNDNNPCNPSLDLTLSADALSIFLKPLLPTLDSVLREALANDSSPGGAVVSLVYKDAVIWTGGYGLKDMKDSSLGVPDKDTRFRIGSVTKLFTALLTLMMRDSGHVESLDDNISLYYPEFKVQNLFRTKRGVTFRQLMSHMSGLPRNSPCEGMFVTGCKISDAEILKNIAGMKLMYPPGTQPAYSNLGFGLLGKVLTHVTKASSWDDLLEKAILQPLGMKDTGNSFDNYDPKKMAIGYYPDGSEAELIDIGWDRSAGQSYSTTADLAKLMSLVFSTDKSSNEQLVDGETLREWIQPAFLNSDETGFSYPWEIDYSEDFKLFAKDGVINGYNTKFQMILEGKIGFILLQSCDGCKSHQVIINKTMTMMSIMLGALIAKNLYSATPIPPRPQDYEALYIVTAGKREMSVNVSLQFFKSQPLLTITKNNDTTLLQWHAEDTFQVTYSAITQTMLLPSSLSCSALTSGFMGAWVYFQRDSGDKVVSLSIPGLDYEVFYKRQK